ncbi:MAG: hypothetical protein ACK5U0_03175 [Gemmatimonas sp.]|jgi:hypothetical protein|uniref:hypothetical protein n=2 Tax=Gemmatimonas sp. TaxID=1962908 RepID=UPI0022C8C6B1|nr:hypothetical protein [Gemmatimonas sp.]MCA2989393.1 hypothetical protein [Gemmatimonas sp.]MCA2996364.1 hypothetical protein [Gemmatimonas sp.]MCE2954815.1 hypothetical protein [Gemmatimonas sp.]MCZ8013534.1 hypothetical protein [Gemmatimonas sp.]MCZ8265790.1 hypothetical protein [Gemmatimonas sp.]
MRADTAERLLRATGASSLFVDDVLGDLEELRTQRQRAGQSGGRWWYATEVLRALPHAQRDGLRGVGLSHLLDWTQKAIAAWILLGVAALITGCMIYGMWSALTPPAERPAIWLPSGLSITGLLIAGALNYLLLGYVAAWMERDRPLIVTMVAALLGAGTHTLLVRDGIGEVGVGVLLFPMMVGGLIAAGGTWRVARGGLTRP